MPSNIKTYDGTGDPEDHVKVFQVATQVERWAMPTWCHMFNSALIGATRVWFDELPPESIDGYKDMKAAFLSYFMQQKKYVKDPVEIHNIKQWDGETLEDFMKRFKIETGRMKGAPECMRISGFMHGINNPELTKRLNEHVPRTMKEMMIATAAFIRGEAVAANKKRATCPGSHMTNQRSIRTKGLTFEPPPPMVTPVEKRNGNKFCDFHKDKGHSTDECMQLKKQIEELVRAEKLSHLIKEIKQGSEQPKTGRKEAAAKEKPTTIYMRQMVPVTTSLTGFSGETTWPLGQLKLLVTIGDATHSTKAWMNFMIVKSLSPYNGIIGRPGLKAIQAVPSTVHRMLKFLIEEGIVTIRSSLLIPAECASVDTSSVTPREKKARPANFTVPLHPNFPDQEVVVGGSLSDKGRTELNVREGYPSVWQKKKGQAPERTKSIQAEVEMLVEAGIMREVFYHDWLSNPVMVKKYDGSWRMCVDFTDLNKACPQDCYPLPEIDRKVESLCGYPFKCFLDAYKGYHQIQMAAADEEKTAFHTGQGVYCYTKMPFSLKNAGATLAKGVFLGYVITPEGIKPCPNKMTAVLQLPSPQTIKKVQSLNGKLASLNRFLSKSAKKSLPLFQTLKKCIKKSDFCLTTEAEQAFQQLKQHFLALPLLAAPKPHEELIMYLSATHGAISAVLLTERGTTQTPVYFISRALQGPELNYSSMEKLVLSLVFAAKRLRRYFQAHPIVVITDQPIKQVMSRPDAAGRLQKWSIILGEHNITYRPRTSIKAQILADFLNEMPSNASQVTSVAETQEEPWTLFTDGSSCVDGSGVRLILTNPNGVEFTYALRFQFAASNNEAEYEALIAGLRIATQMGEDNMIKYLDIAKGLVIGFKTFSISQVPQIIEEEGPTWMTELVNYLKEGTLPKDEKEARKIRLKARQYELMEGILYKRSFLTPWLKCVGPLQAEYVMKEIHEGSCSMHARPRSVVAKAIRLGYFWPTLHKDAQDMICKCSDCQIHLPVTRHPQQPLTPITAPWPFYKWGIDIAGPFPEGPRKVKFLIVAMDYFTKWIEAKSVATITGGQVKKFIWDNIVCRFGISGEIISDNVISAEIGMPTYRTTVVDVVNNDDELRLNLDLLEERRELAAMNEARSKSKMMKYYNSQVRGVAFQPGDFVYHSNDASHAVAGGKLGPKWEGPYEVTDALGNGAYK
nr:reverse transcriptase domain-containing protein [Tanacetum cinerariifolium]